MVERRLSKEKYLIAGVLTLLVFGLGITLGILVDNARLQRVTQDAEEQEAEQRSIQFLSLYLGSLENEGSSCNVMNIALNSAVKDLSYSLEEFSTFKEMSKLNDEQYRLAGRRYIVDNLRYWYFARTMKEQCETDLIPILYFYSDEHCDICGQEGKLLTYFKKLLGDRVLVFPINTDLETDETAITLVRGKYNTTMVPSIVVDDTLYEGVHTQEELGNIICNAFAEPREECETYT